MIAFVCRVSVVVACVLAQGCVGGGGMEHEQASAASSPCTARCDDQHQDEMWACVDRFKGDNGNLDWCMGWADESWGACYDGCANQTPENLIDRLRPPADG